MRGLCAVIGIGMLMMAWHTFVARQWLLFAMSMPWAAILLVAAIFGEEVP